MGVPQRGTKKHKQNKTGRAYHQVRKPEMKKQHDQIHEDLKPENRKKFEKMVRDEDKPGEGQHYCISCDM